MSKQVRAAHAAFGASTHGLRRPVAAAVLTALGLVACGGGGGGDAPPATPTTPVTTVDAGVSFPSGLSVGSPSDLSSATTVASLDPPSGLRYSADWARAAWAALQQGDTHTLAKLATGLVPTATALAAPAVEPDLKASAATIDRVLSADAALPLASVLNLGTIFGIGGNAPCYGPNVAYSSHQDGTPAAGTLPGGDVGIWLASETGGQPCVAAQLNARVAGVKGRARQGLLLMAVMRAAIARDSSLSLPTAGTSVNLQTALSTALAAVPLFSGVTVSAATVALNSGGTEYTYRLVVSHGSGLTARTGEVVLRHTPGASRTAYTGVMQVAGFELGNDPAFGCTDQMSLGRYQVAQVSSIKYSRAGSALQFSSRDGQYCGALNPSSSHHAADVAAFESDGELDPSVKVSGSTRGSTLGWRGNFTRFAADFDRSTVAGNFLSVWQAGTGDSHARALAINSAYNSATEVRTLNGYFGFATEISATSNSGDLLGMVCNWAGPGNNHTPSARFQSQTATLASSATQFTLGTSLITYAPTNSCASTTTSFDVNADNTLAVNEGVGTAVGLDVPSGSNTVQQEITARGYTKPAMF